MRTDVLIDLLGANVERRTARRLAPVIIGAITAGTLLATGAVLLGLGVRHDLVSAPALAFLLLKLALMIAVLVPAAVFLIRLSRPGGERKTPLALLSLPFAVIVALGMVSLALTPHAHWRGAVLGDQWLECVISIPLIAIVPFALIIWAVRRMAPTDLKRAGAVAGLVAGSISAVGYALHCTDDTVPFVALWYGGTLAACMLAGALLGPRLLRW